MEELTTYTLEEISIGKGTYGIGAPAIPFDKNKRTYLRITDIKEDGTLNKDGLMSVEEEKADEYLLAPNDIVFARTGNSTGRTYFYEESDGIFCYAGFLIKFTLNPNKVNPRILKYYTHSKAYYDWVHSFDTGGTRGNINAKTYGQMPVTLPSKERQDRIVEICKSLDDKIEVNKRINDNLERQAQALFKSWFVDNPDSNWKKISLSEVASFVGGYSYTGKELTDFSNVAMATIKNFMRNGGFKAEGFKGINPSAKLKECHYANLFDILVAHTDLTQNADVIGNAELLLTCGKYNSIIFSMDLVKVLPKEIFPYSFLLAAMLKNKMFKAHCLGYINGTTVLHLNKKALPEFEIRKPSDSEAKIMNETLAPYYKRMAKLLQETDKLISLRDTLLPKLMSGELKINDINN